MTLKDAVENKCLQGIGAVYRLVFAEPKENPVELTKLEELAIVLAVKVDKVTGGAFSAIRDIYGLY